MNAEAYTARVMGLYAQQLLRPWVKVLVLAAFVALAVLSGISFNKLKVQFDAMDVVPKGSYVKAFPVEIETHTGRAPVGPDVYFRNVDQSDPMVREQMEADLQPLVHMKYVSRQPEFVWFRGFKTFVNQTGISNISFPEQMDAFLSVPQYRELYRGNIVRDPDTGTVFQSRCNFRMDKIDMSDVSDQTDALTEQYAITMAHVLHL